MVRSSGIRAVARSVISDGDLKPSVTIGAFDPYRPAFRTNGNGVLHRVFSQRLHRERKKVKVEGFRVDLQVHFQPVFIAELLQRKILTREVVLLGKFHQLATIFFQRVAQHVPKTLDRTFGHRRAKLYQSGQRVKSVEQEMWIQTDADCVQARRCGQRLGTRSKRLLFVQPIPRLHGMGNSREHRVKPNSHQHLPTMSGPRPESFGSATTPQELKSIDHGSPSDSVRHCKGDLKYIEVQSEPERPRPTLTNVPDGDALQPRATHG